MEVFEYLVQLCIPARVRACNAGDQPLVSVETCVLLAVLHARARASKHVSVLQCVSVLTLLLKLVHYGYILACGRVSVCE
jgi:hypothetical protein